MRKVLLIIGLMMACCSMHAADRKENHPYSDDNVMHYGGFIGVNLPSYIVRPQEMFTTPHVGYGLTIGGYVDVRMGKYLNLRVSPSYNANFLNIRRIGVDSINSLVMPFAIPLHIKWSAKRIGNYKPYLIGGGGVSFDFNAFDEEKKELLTKKMNYFAEVGLGCDFFSKWFRCSPELRYQFGFNNMLMPQNEDGTWGDNGWKPSKNEAYMQNLEQMLYHQVSIVFNFGSL